MLAPHRLGCVKEWPEENVTYNFMTQNNLQVSTIPLALLVYDHSADMSVCLSVPAKQ
jgi:hypothetical protein